MIGLRQTPLDQLITGNAFDIKTDIVCYRADNGENPTHEQIEEFAFNAARLSVQHEIDRAPTEGSQVIGFTLQISKELVVPQGRQYAISLQTDVLPNVIDAQEISWPDILGSTVKYIADGIVSELREDGIS